MENLNRRTILKIEDVKRQAFLVMSEMAFLVCKNENNRPFLRVLNLNNLSIYLDCNIYNNQFRLRSTNMSEVNKYKVLLYIERNKDRILRSLKENG